MSRSHHPTAGSSAHPVPQHSKCLGIASLICLSLLLYVHLKTDDVPASQTAAAFTTAASSLSSSGGAYDTLAAPPATSLVSQKATDRTRKGASKDRTDELLRRVEQLEEAKEKLEKEVKVLRLKSWQEHLDPQFHYRAKHTLGKTNDPEDRMGIEPFYLGHMVNTTEIRRRVYIDLGMREFSSSLCYMLQAYPAEFTELHAFECCPRVPPDVKDDDPDKLPPLQEKEVAACLKEGNKFQAAKYTTKGVMSATHLYRRFVGAKEDPTRQQPQVSLNGFLKKLDLKEEDFVVIKMDIEGEEYETIRALVAEPKVAAVVDELMVEVHYAHPEMAWAVWHLNFPDHSLSEAHVLLQKARDAGIVVHPWP